MKKFDSNWYDAYLLLTKYRYQNPAKWPGRFEIFENFKLGAWCSTQRTLKKKDELPDSRVQSLEIINFNFGCQKGAIWEKKFDLLCEYRREFPFRWPHAKEIYKNIKLGEWVVTQRRLWRAQKLSEDRLVELDRIEFEWVYKHGMSSHARTTKEVPPEINVLPHIDR